MTHTAVGNGVGAKTQRKSYSRTSNLIELPRLIEIQLQSFEWFRDNGLKELFEEISPIVSFNKHLELHFGDFRFDDAKHTEEMCRIRDITYSAPLWVEVRLVNNDTGEISEQEVFMGDFPLMTDSGTFIVNGSERVVVSQLIRSPGVYFTVEEDRSTGRDLTGTKLIPLRGAWLEFETSKRDIISVKVDRKRKLPATILLRAIGFGTDEEIRELFADIDDNEDHPFIEGTLERDPTANPTEDRQKGIDDALLEFYKKLRPGDPATLDNARNFLQNLLFTPRRYDLGRVGRYKLNRKLGQEAPLTTRILTNDDIVSVIRRIIDINNGREVPDDIDHLGNRRIKTVGELIQSQLRIGLLRMERVVRERMSIREPEQVTPLSLINIRPVVAATREFFGSSQLSQFMDQTNPLAELTHKRRLSALGPGGLRRERAGFDVRDVHYSHYGRICPIETPEGPNIGLIGYLATYGRINDFGFIETPYRRVINTVRNLVREVTGRILLQDIVDPYSGDILDKRGDEIKLESAQVLAALYPRVVEEVRVQLLSGLEQEEQSRIAEFVARIGLFSSEAGRQAERLRDWIHNNLGETAKDDKHLIWLDDIILIDDVVEANHDPIVGYYMQERLNALKSVLDSLEQEEKSQIEALSERIDQSSSEAHSGAQETKKWIQRNLGKTAKKDQHLDWPDAVILIDDVVESKHDRMVDFCVKGRLDALKSVLDALKQEEKSQIEALSERIDRSSSEAHSGAQETKKWIQRNLGKTAKKDQHLDWPDAVILIDDVVESKHDRMVDFCVKGRLDALKSVLDALKQEEKSQIEALSERIDRSSSEAHSGAQETKKWIQRNLGEAAKKDQHLDWLDAVILIDDVVESKHDRMVDFCVQGRLDALRTVSDKATADIRDASQAKQTQLHQQLDALGEEEQSQIEALTERFERSSSEARGQAEQLQEWIQRNLGRKAGEDQRLDWVADAIIVIDEVIEAKHQQTVNDYVQARLAALQSVSDKEEADIREAMQAKRAQLHQELDTLVDDAQSQIEVLRERIDRSSSKAHSQAQQLRKWIQSNLGKKAKEVQHLDWVDAILSGDEAVETMHEQMVDYYLQARLAAIQSISDKEEADIRAQFAALAERIDIDRSSSKAHSQAQQLRKWIQSNLGKKAKEVQHLDWVDAILSGDEAVETMHEQMVDYYLQARLAAIQSISDKEEADIRAQFAALAERIDIDRSSSEARRQASRLRKWIQSNLGATAKEVQRLDWVDAILSGDEAVETMHEQMVDYYLQARLAALQSISDKEEADIRAQFAALAERIDRSSSEARRQASRLRKWIQSNLGATAKEVQRLDWVDAILSGDEAVETMHEQMVDYYLQARLAALQSVNKKTKSFIRKWIQAKRTRLETSSEKEESQVKALTERFELSSSEARGQAEQLQEWIQSNLGKKAKEDQLLDWVDAALIARDEVVEAEHEQNVNDFLQARLTTLQSEFDEEETYIHVRSQAKQIDVLTGDKKDGEVLPKLDEQIAAQKDLIDAMKELKEFRVHPFVSQEVIYLNADTEERASIAQASTPLDKAGHFLNRRPSVRQAEEFRFEEPHRIQYMDVSPKQVVGVSAALIPFLEHDDTNRALMGSNMQRQAVPLVKPDAPIVGTGMEWQAAVDSGQVVVARKAGEAIRVVNTEIVIQEEDDTLHTYPLRKYNRSNQSTCIDQRPTIQKGDLIEAGTVLADSSSTQNGELALGQNVLVAYMSWEGGNYEDAILVSERLIENDKYTSVHIEKHEIEARETKLGPEEITRDIPNVGEDALRHLDEDGIIRIGAEVAAGDILVGKITPKGETELTPEEKLLRAIFGEKAREVKDSSLRLPHGERGKVVDIKVFTREDHQDMPAGVEKMVRVSIAQRRRLTEGDKMAGRHGNKGVISRVVPVEDMPFLEDGTPIDIILNPLGVPGRMNIGQILETHLGWAADRLGFMAETPVFDGAQEDEIESELARAWLIDRAWQDVTQQAWASVHEQKIDSESLVDDNDARRLYLLEWLEPRGYEPERLFFDDKYARNAALAEWLQDKGYEAERVIPETRSDDSDLFARYVSLREWMLFHGCEPDEPDRATLTEAADNHILAHYTTGEQLNVTLLEEFAATAQQYSKQNGWPLPTTGKQKLFDGKTGEPYDANVTIGIAQMLKLHHLVEDKVHARSTGPYSLVTQQPLGGKAQFGGQRFGEMEVWALEAYGAAYTLQEMLTIKSDDTTGRVKTYEAIVKGEAIQSPGVPESFRVLVKELQSLALSIEVIDDKNEVIQLGKDEAEDRLPHLGFSLNVPSPMSRSSE